MLSWRPGPVGNHREAAPVDGAGRDERKRKVWCDGTDRGTGIKRLDQAPVRGAEGIRARKGDLKNGTHTRGKNRHAIWLPQGAAAGGAAVNGLPHAAAAAAIAAALYTAAHTWLASLTHSSLAFLPNKLARSAMLSGAGAGVLGPAGA